MSVKTRTPFSSLNSGSASGGRVKDMLSKISVLDWPVLPRGKEVAYCPATRAAPHTGGDPRGPGPLLLSTEGRGSARLRHRLPGHGALPALHRRTRTLTGLSVCMCVAVHVCPRRVFVECRRGRCSCQMGVGVPILLAAESGDERHLLARWGSVTVCPREEGFPLVPLSHCCQMP